MMLVPRALRVLAFGCEVCGQRRRCWRRWHVEVFDCPTCGREVDEYDPAFGKVLQAHATPPPWKPSITVSPGSFIESPKTYVTWNTGGTS